MDVFKLSQTLYRKDNKTWKKIQKNGRIPLEEDTIKSISIHIQLKSTGRNNINPIFQKQHNKGLQERY